MGGRLLVLLLGTPLSRLYSFLVGAAARATWTPWKNALIQRYIRHFHIRPEDLEEFTEPDPFAYPSLDAFFTRSLRPTSRKPPEDPACVTSPVDGVLGPYGTIQEDQLLQAKHLSYTISELLGDPQEAEDFQNGAYLTLYLSPRHYHRTHLPLDASPQTLRYLPGRLLSVNPNYSARTPRLYSRNERVSTIFATPADKMALVMVGAIGVSAITLACPGFEHGLPTRHTTTHDLKQLDIHWQRCQEFGTFHMGSCVILLFQPKRIRWSKALHQGQEVRMAEPLGHIHPTATPNKEQPSI